MGRYINYLPNGTLLPQTNKAQELIAAGATRLDKTPTEWREGLIAVRSAGAFDSAAYMYSDKELKEYVRGGGPKLVWLHHPQAKDLAERD